MSASRFPDPFVVANPYPMALTIPPLLRQGFAQSKDALVAAAGFSLALNLLTLAMPIYTLQL